MKYKASTALLNRQLNVPTRVIPAKAGIQDSCWMPDRVRYDGLAYLAAGLVILCFFIVQSCSVNRADTPDKFQKVALDPVQEQEISVSTIQRLEESISGTPYSALIQYTGVDVSTVPDPYPNDDNVEEKHIYHAKVLETFRGEKQENINFTLYCEKGEETSIDKEPVVITLCINSDGFFWPGTGSEFPATEEIIETARRIAQKVIFDERSFPYCELAK
jgi:hypothetical protein